MNINMYMYYSYTALPLHVFPTVIREVEKMIKIREILFIQQ